ncbi:SP_1767 family glycosyltransferase [Alkalihalobacillus sp. BA299]|uniref:SP_1767 family glycosyltransferase n=1 Tax=Alkalihalobacillus sp. BA299 TaxID=2815938 RepID=UPI001ADC7A60|nr:SP_1767 family glycosyltransferase [Alkalihalobacillus sp. BA299]
METLRLKSILVYLWNKGNDIKIVINNNLKILKDFILRSIVKAPKIKNIDESIDNIIANKASVCRYGDGEFKLIENKSITFQVSNKLLSKRLKEILNCQEDQLMVCLPDVFGDLNIYSEEPKAYWRLHIAKFRLQWYKHINKKMTYYNSFLSRFYYTFEDKSRCSEWISKLKQIWSNRDIVIIEGKKSRLGIGNDLFDNVSSIERILVPEENAFNFYDEILKEAKKCDKNKVILLAAGPTATVLAYDLYKEGYQSIDIGHVDIEYEWFLRGAKTKVQIENKYVCEAGAGKDVGELKDEKYLSEIKVVI